MITDQTNFDALKRCALSEDWKAAADVYLEIALEAKGTPESLRVESLGPLLSLRDAEQIVAAVNALADLSQLPSRGGDRLTPVAPDPAG